MPPSYSVPQSAARIGGDCIRIVCVSLSIWSCVCVYVCVIRIVI